MQWPVGIPVWFIACSARWSAIMSRSIQSRKQNNMRGAKEPRTPTLRQPAAASRSIPLGTTSAPVTFFFFGTIGISAH
jgi:hypothetical protein